MNPYKNRRIDLELPVQVYRNVHRKVWSIRQSGKVVAHTNSLVLRDCKYVVNIAGRELVRKNKKKFVHAWVEGFISKKKIKFNPYRKVTYNPYEYLYFEINDYGCRTNILSSKYTVFTKDEVSAEDFEIALFVTQAAYDDLIDKIENPPPLDPEVLERWKQIISKYREEITNSKI